MDKSDDAEPAIETAEAPISDVCVEPAPACEDQLFDVFETIGAPWAPADWATATAGGLVDLEDGQLKIPVRFAGDGYEQGYVGRQIETTLEGCASVGFDVTLPASAPNGLRAKAIVHLGTQWTEGETAFVLVPGETTHVSLPMAHVALDQWRDVTAIGVKLEANDTTYSGDVFLDNVGRVRNTTFTMGAPRPVGVFGGFGTNVPEENGFLTFHADAHAGRHTLSWPKLGADGKTLTLLQTRFGTLETSHEPLGFIDWTTVEAKSIVLDGFGTKPVTATMSRVMPAVRYDTTATTVEFATAFEGRAPMHGVVYVHDGEIVTRALTDAAYALSHMSEPWMILYTGGGSFEAPILVTFELKPTEMKQTSDGIRVTRTGGLGAVQVMPFFGLSRRETFEVTDSVINQARVLGTILAAFPVGTRETYELAGDEVMITDQFDYAVRPDAWGTTPRKVAVLPPLTAAAKQKDYPVKTPQWLSSLDVDTFYGPMMFADGDTVNYTLPAPNGLSRLELPVRVDNDETVAPIRTEMLRVIRDVVPNEPATAFIDGNDRTAAFLCEALQTLDRGTAEHDKASAVAAKMISYGWLDSSLQTLEEPVTHQSYVNNAKYWASNEPFDKEWYTGRQLAALGLCHEQLDGDLARGVWAKARAMYRYDQIFFDWALGSTLSSVYGLTALIDGLYFAWEGMQSMARLGRELGDKDIERDATYRAARQQLAVFMLWHHAEWLQKIDYGIGHISGKKLAKEQLETRGPIDGFVEDFGAASLEMKSFWQTSNMIAFDVRPQFAFYRDFGLSSRLYTIMYGVMPDLHPYWYDGNVFDEVDKRYYGSQYAAFHIAARAAMFHAEPGILFDHYENSAESAASKEWYSMRWHGVAGPMLLDLARARAPQVELPTGQATTKELRYDLEKRTLKITLQGRITGDAKLRITWPRGSVQDETVRLCNGETRELMFEAR